MNLTISKNNTEVAFSSINRSGPRKTDRRRPDGLPRRGGLSKRHQRFRLKTKYFALFFVITFPAHSLSLSTPKEIYADEIFFDARTGSVTGAGNASVRAETGQTMRSDFMSLSNPGGQMNVSMAEIFLNPQVRITAAELQMTKEEIRANQMTYTACWGCDAGTLAWEFRATKMVNDRPAQNMHFHSATFFWQGIPIFWLPYFTQPDPTVRRRSGLLMPKMGTTNLFGATLEVPLYVAFSDYHDMTLTPVWLELENPLLKIEHRMNQGHATSRTTGSITHNRQGKTRWHIFNDERIELGDNMLALISVNRTSDKLYLREYEFYDAQPFLDTSARLELYGQDGYATAEVRSFQELRQQMQNQASSNGDILPRFRAATQTGPIIGSSYLNLNADFLNLSHSSQSDNTSRLTGEAKYTYPLIIPFGQKLEFSLGARYDIYQFMNAELLDGTTGYTGMKSRFLPQGAAAISWPLVNPGKNWTQVLEPKARIVIMDHSGNINFINQDSSGSLLTDTSIFADNRYSGFDLWNNGSFADYGLGWTAFDGKGRSVELFAGQSYDFHAPEDLNPNSGFHNGRSDYVGRLKIMPENWLAFTNRFRFERDSLELRHLESDVRLGTKNFVQVGYLRAVQLDQSVMLDRKFDEALAAVGASVTDRLRVGYNMAYNITDKRVQRRGLHMTYDHPCYSISLTFSDDRAEDLSGRLIGSTSYRMQFNLKIQGI